MGNTLYKFFLIIWNFLFSRGTYRDSRIDKELEYYRRVEGLDRPLPSTKLLPRRYRNQRKIK